MNDSSEFLRSVEAIFQKVMEASQSLRPALLESECRGDAELLEEVVSLIKACEMEEAETSSSKKEEARAEALRGHRRVGPYELDRLVGHGGMGAVYLAHRADGQFEQKVAIKLIDLPFVTELFRGRFRQERQILAKLAHPNIARMLDGGVSDEGELYLAMEYAAGLTIQQYCVQHSLSVRERIVLFQSVCAAVRFAHQNLVVHRDLKPANIIVLDDGTPKLLDFGTAKLLAPVDAAVEGEFTRHGLQSFTPQYASPEQILGHPISTASDIYSLGVLLYVLVAGVPPYELKDSTTDEMIRVICKEQPPKPSAKAPPGTLDADVDAIVLKALRKEPEERYGSVDQLMADLQAYLDGRPVAARHGSFRYFAGKFIRRNKLALTAAILVFASMLAGIGGVVWQARIANVERRKAEARAEDLRKLSNRLLSEIDEAIQKLPGSTPAQKLLVSTVLEHLDRAAKDSANDPQTQVYLANGYIRLGNVQGNPYDQNIGDTPGALNSVDKALSIASTLVKQEPQDAGAAHALGWAQQSKSEILFGMGKTQDAVAMMRVAAATYEELANRAGANADEVFDAASAYGSLGDELGQSGAASLSDPAGALAAFQKTLELDERAVKLDPQHYRAMRGIAMSHAKIGKILAENDPAAALPDYQKAIDGMNALPDEVKKTLGNRRTLGSLYRWRGMALKETGRYQEALSYIEQARAVSESFVAADPNDTRAETDLLAAVENEAECFEDRAQGVFTGEKADRKADAASALRSLTEARSIVEHLLQSQPNHTLWRSTLGLLMVRMSLQQRALQQREGTRELAAKGVAILKDVGQQPNAQGFDLDSAATGLTIVEPEELRDPRLAVEYAERMVDNSHRQKAGYLLTLARAYRAAGQVEKARLTAREGFILLPVPTANTVSSRIRRQLQAEFAR